MAVISMLTKDMKIIIKTEKELMKINISNVGLLDIEEVEKAVETSEKEVEKEEKKKDTMREALQEVKEEEVKELVEE